VHETRNDIGERTAVLLEDGGDVADGLLRLRLDRVACQLAVLGEAALAREEDETVGGSGR